MLCRLYCIFLCILCVVSHAQAARVAHVIDGDTFVLENGDTVRLLGINTPEIGRKGYANQYFAEEARDILTQLVLDQDVSLTFANRGAKKDKYGRLLAFAKLSDGTMVNAYLVSQGFAYVYTFPDTIFDVSQLLALEATARAQDKGIWKKRQVWDAAKHIDDSAIGGFGLVQGTVKSVKKVKKHIYINFGNDWRTDFSVEIPKNFWSHFPYDPFMFSSVYQGKNVLVRGKLKPVNGVLVTVTHPAQIEILN